ncbi:MAG: PLP-dependent aminotransferase family protein [Candidatus Eremiobacteraeota bacterium]|nr:PLP-dependent aminotransferase family protein [Candidatus Eremiobacteraeota bacterium]
MATELINSATPGDAALAVIKQSALTGTGPLYGQLAECIAALITSGQLPFGSAMPRVRDLARGLGISIVTAAHAYRVLGERGLVAARPGVGTFVAQPLPKGSEPSLPDAANLAWQRTFIHPKPTVNLSYIYRLPVACGHAQWSFFSVPSYGGEMLPLSRRIMRRVALDAEVAHCRPTDTQGLPELRAAMAAHLHDESIDVGPERILITNSYEEALVLTLLAFCNEGDAIAIEDPSQFCIVDAARLRGLRLIGIPMDEKGMRTDVLDALTARESVRIVVLSPRAQNPTGWELHEPRRQQLYQLARQHNWLIFECDSFARLHYRGRPQLPLLCDDPDGRVIYVRPISRGLLMNLGIAIATGRVLERLIEAKDIVDRGSDVFLQLILRRLLDSGCIARQDAQMRRQWGDQLSALLAALERTMPRSVRFTHPRGGGSVWVTMPEGCSAETLLQRALQHGISFIPGRAFAVTERHDRSFRLAVGNLMPAQMIEAINVLSSLIKDYVAEEQRNRMRVAIAKVS